MGYRRRRHHQHRLTRVPSVYGSIWLDQPPRLRLTWLDEPWVHVLLAFLLMGALYVGVSWLIQFLGGPSA
jgi:hypothetical protein